MKERRKNRQLEADLAAMLGPPFPGMAVRVEHSNRWNRECAVFRWPGFADLLPEERFHRLAAVIPDGFRTSRMAGVVWVELAPGETVEEYEKLPRSEDVAGREADIYNALIDLDFFDLLGKALGPSPEARCDGGFTLAMAVLREKKCSPDEIHDAKLLLIRHGVYCDCRVIPTARPALANVGAEVL